MKNRKDMTLNSNRFKDKFNILALGIAECQPRAGRVCNSSAEISSWLEDNPIYFIMQKSHVEADMFEDSKRTQKWPHNIRPKD